MSRPRLIAVCGYSDRTGEELHEICARRLRRAEREARADDVVLLTGWARGRSAASEAELMARSWAAPCRRVFVDSASRSTLANVAAAASVAREVGRGARSSWSRPAGTPVGPRRCFGWRSEARDRRSSSRPRTRGRRSGRASENLSAGRSSLSPRSRHELSSWPGGRDARGARGGPCSTPTAVLRRTGPTRRPSRSRLRPADRARRDHALVQGRWRPETPVPSWRDEGVRFHEPVSAARLSACRTASSTSLRTTCPGCRRSLTCPLPVRDV